MKLLAETFASVISTVVNSEETVQIFCKVEAVIYQERCSIPKTERACKNEDASKVTVIEVAK